MRTPQSEPNVNPNPNPNSNLNLRQDEETVYFRVILGQLTHMQAIRLLRDHFNINRGVTAAHFIRYCHELPGEFYMASLAVPGVRVLHIINRLEALVSFVGSGYAD